MGQWRFEKWVWGLRRRPIAVAALAIYLAAVVGVPLPAALKKQRDAAFPCQGHACGCLSARECWEHCCCFSPKQKLAWARSHGITPPARLVAVVETIEANPLLTSRDEHADDETESACHDEHEAPGGSCCARRAACSTSHEHEPAHDHGDCHQAVAERACCGDRGHDGDDNAHDDARRAIVIKARQCQGLGELWCLTGAVMPAPAACDWHFQWDVVERLPVGAALWRSADLAPPIPPPRV